MTLTSWFSAMRHSGRRTRTGSRHSRSVPSGRERGLTLWKTAAC